MSIYKARSKLRFLEYVADQHLCRIPLGFIDGSTRWVEPLVKEGFLRKEGGTVILTAEGRERLNLDAMSWKK